MTDEEGIPPDVGDGEGYSLSELDPELVRSSQRSKPEPMAVPATPVHTCARCGYNLTGLISRQCPECGTAFSLFSGQNVVRGASVDLEDIRAIWLDRAKLAVGAVALLFGIVAPWIDFTGTYRPFRGLNGTFINFWIMRNALQVQAASDVNWSTWLFRVGLISAAASGVLLFFIR